MSVVGPNPVQSIAGAAQAERTAKDGARRPSERPALPRRTADEVDVLVRTVETEDAITGHQDGAPPKDDSRSSKKRARANASDPTDDGDKPPTQIDIRA